MSEEEKTEPEVKEAPVIKVKPNWLVKNWLVLCLVLVVVILGSYVGYGAYGSYKDKNLVTVTPTVTATATPTVAPSQTDRIVDEGVTWVTPERLDDLNIVRKSSGNAGQDYQSTQYYKVGFTSSGSDIVLAKIEFAGMGTYYNFQRFLKKGTSYTLLSKNSDNYDVNNGPFELVYESSTSGGTVLQSILPDESFIDGKTKMVYAEYPSRNVEFADGETGSKIGNTKWGDLYKIEQKDIKDSNGKTFDQMAVAQYYIKLNDSTKQAYNPTPTFKRDDNSWDLEFTSATESANAYKFDKLATGGCGLGGGSFPILTDESQISGKKLLGKNGTANVYYVDDVNSDIIKFGYEMYKVGRNEDQIKSIQEFVDNYGVVFWKDAYNSTIIFMNSDWAPQAECGKPVIYLYPDSEMDISVKVGAKITVSDPEYGNGWNVTAKPSGELKLAGQTYPYLFWEGLGFGKYPAITSGTVVARADVASTINKQLSQIGLNTKEIADFNEFWLPKMPTKPYVRLTWLQNKEMDELAPLKITPAPTSVIRVFLDFQGHDQKINIPVQQLISYPRDGYTAVEWGGLLNK